jgi:hypothetical protein
MKRNLLLLLIAIVSTTLLSAQNESSNHRRVAREVESMMEISSDLMNEVMTYGKAKKINALADGQFDIWRKSKRSFSRLDGEGEKAMFAAAEQGMETLVEATSGPLRDWANEDPRSSYGHEYLKLTKEVFGVVLAELDAYAEANEVNARPMNALDRYETQLELAEYTATMKAGASRVDSLVDFMKANMGTTDLDIMFKAQKDLIKALSEHLRGYGEELFFNGQTELHEAYQRYYVELLELTSADLLADITKMKYDLVEFRSIDKATERSAVKTLSFFDNEKKLLTKREARFVKANLPKAPKK